MRKYGILLLILLLCLTGCGRNEVNPELVITCAPREEENDYATRPAEGENPQVPGLKDFVFTSDGVDLIPGTAFDPSVLPAAESVYEVPSCAIEGTDNLYNYGSFELTAFHDGTEEMIYSILLLDPNIATPEGLALGDDGAKVTALYGDGYTKEGTARVYTGTRSMLYIILQGQSVASIEYRMIVGK